VESNVLVRRGVEEEVSQDGSEAAEGVDSEWEEDHVPVEDVADDVVAGDRCACRRVAFCDASEFALLREL
jgi:hypothetical protein